MRKLESNKDTLKFPCGVRTGRKFEKFKKSCWKLETVDGQRSLGALQRLLRTSQTFPVHGQRAAATHAAVAGGSPEPAKKFQGFKTKIQNKNNQKLNKKLSKHSKQIVLKQSNDTSAHLKS